MDSYTLRKSGVIPAGLSPQEMRDWQAGTGRFAPKPEPPKSDEPKPASPTFAQAQVKPPGAQAQATPAPAAPEQPAEVVTVGDLHQEIHGAVVRVLQGMPEKFRGPQGVPGRDINGPDLKAAIEKIVEQKLQAVLADERFRGPAGHDGKDSTVPGPVGPQGPQGIPGKDSTVPGPAGKTIIVERNVIERGDRGDVGPSGPRGPAGLDEKQITELVCTILTNANAVSEQTLKLIAVTMELDAIETDAKYHRLGVVRNEIVNRLKEKLC